MHLLKKLLHLKRVYLSGVVAAKEKWDKEYLLYKTRTGEELSDAVQRMCLMALVPETLQQHLELNMSRLGTRDIMWHEVERYVESRTSRVAAEAMPMELDPLNWKGKGKGKDRGRSLGKGKTSREDKGRGKGKKAGAQRSSSQNLQHTDCWICGKRGHRQKDCWYNAQARSSSLGKARESKGNGKGTRMQSAGKSAKGKGKSKQSKQRYAAVEDEDDFAAHDPVRAAWEQWDRSSDAAYTVRPVR